MTICHTCGNDYQKTFRVIKDGSTYEFDSFECAIHALAPQCEHCGCRVIGHGVQSDTDIFCSAHCASAAGVTGLMDHTQPKLIAGAF
jgi:nitrite reductase/ring-hydroxylating ferredoxin subunit